MKQPDPTQCGNTIDAFMEILKQIRDVHGNLHIHLEINDLNRFLPIIGISVGEHNGENKVSIYSGIDFQTAIEDLKIKYEVDNKQKRGTH